MLKHASKDCNLTMIPSYLRRAICTVALAVCLLAFLGDQQRAMATASPATPQTCITASPCENSLEDKQNATKTVKKITNRLLKKSFKHFRKLLSEGPDSVKNNILQHLAILSSILTSQSSQEMALNAKIADARYAFEKQRAQERFTAAILDFKEPSLQDKQNFSLALNTQGSDALLHNVREGLRLALLDSYARRDGENGVWSQGNSRGMAIMADRYVRYFCDPTLQSAPEDCGKDSKGGILTNADIQAYRMLLGSEIWDKEDAALALEQFLFYLIGPPPEEVPFSDLQRPGGPQRFMAVKAVEKRQALVIDALVALVARRLPIYPVQDHIKEIRQDALGNIADKTLLADVERHIDRMSGRNGVTNEVALWQLRGVHQQLSTRYVGDLATATDGQVYRNIVRQLGFLLEIDHKIQEFERINMMLEMAT